MSDDQNIRGFDYDVAVSFAGEDRKIVERLVEILAQKGVRVFYDSWEKAELWGKNLYQHLDDLYTRRARFVVIFISSNYVNKAWTRHELRSAQARAFSQNSEYILPVRIDDSELPGVPSTVGYLDLRSVDIDRLADLILQKIEIDSVKAEKKPVAPTPGKTAGFRVPKISTTSLDPTQEAHNLITFLEGKLDERVQVLRDQGLSVEKRVENGARIYEIKYKERLLYFLRMRVGSALGEHVIAFLDGWNRPSSDDAATAFAEVKKKAGAELPVVSVTNLSLLDSPGVSITVSSEELCAKIWDKACNVIESMMNN